MDRAGLLRIAEGSYQACLGTHHGPNGAVLVASCGTEQIERVKWNFTEADGRMSPSFSSAIPECLTLVHEPGPKSDITVKLLPCEFPLSPNQVWDWMD
mmetsp:Transcript_33835/g.61936  ORF Transcript_33835/g.61936 Transcript_33835/m.61936 type:complete len:98 (+) Transcript_33835:3-296(+)